MDKVIIDRPVNGIPINSELEFILDNDGAVQYFDSMQQAKAFLFQHGMTGEDMSFFSFLHSCGVCCRCGTPLFPSLMEGYTYQCFKCDEDFYSFEQAATPVQEQQI